MVVPHLPRVTTRRDFLLRAGRGLGGIALSRLPARHGPAETPGASPATRPNPLAALPPHFNAKAKSVIFMFMVGGPSPIDLFDPKPELIKRQGQPLPKD